MLFEGVAEEGDVFMSSLMLVLVVLLGFGRRTLRVARGVVDVRWIQSSFLATSKLASTNGLDVRKSEVLVVV